MEMLGYRASIIAVFGRNASPEAELMEINQQHLAQIAIRRNASPEAELMEIPLDFSAIVVDDVAMLHPKQN